MKKVIISLLVIIMAFSTIAATFTTSNTVRKGDTKSFYRGRAGVAFTNSQFTANVTVTRKSNTSKVPGESPPNFRQKLLDVRLTDFDGNRIKFVLGPVYVYFNVTDKEVRMWDSGKLAIFYYDPWTDSWTKCSTFLISGKNNQLSCRIRVFGLYGLGVPR